LLKSSPNASPLTGNSSLAIAIAGSSVTRDFHQKHVALLYRDPDGRCLIVHQGWHNLFLHEDWTADFHWCELDQLDLELQETLIDYIVLVATQGERHPIPYSVSFDPELNFLETGEFKAWRKESGLTCATFILAMFKQFGLPLVIANSWPTTAERNDDATWVIRILERLEEYGRRASIPMPHVVPQRLQRHALRRFRPEEVVAAAIDYRGEPQHFTVVEPRGVEVLACAPR
jgi:hypothetical protein